MHDNSEEICTLEEMINNMKIYLNNESSFYNNQSMIGMKEFFIFSIVREWLFKDDSRIVHYECNKGIVKTSVDFFNESLKNRCDVSHKPQHQKMLMKNEIEIIKEEEGISQFRKFISSSLSFFYYRDLTTTKNVSLILYFNI